MTVVLPNSAKQIEPEEHRTGTRSAVRDDSAEHNKPSPGLRDLMDHNAVRIERFLNRRFFRMIEDGTLQDEQRRGTFLACLQRISREFQTIMLTRQAFCRDPRYYAAFRHHLEDEFGHDKLMSQRPDSREIKDTILDAILAWFAFQMVVLDNAEKAALMHLVLEAAGDHFTTRAAPVLGPHVPSGFFEIHAELDEGHAAMGEELLLNQHPASYERLKELVDEGWEMIYAMTGRMVSLVEETATSTGAP